MHRSRSSFWGTLAVALVACNAPAPGTSIVLVVTADAAVTARSGAVRLHVRGRSSGNESETFETREVDARSWPLHAVLVPRDGDASHALQIELDALEGATPIARVAASTRFVEGEAKTVVLHFEASCLGVACADGEACTRGRGAPAPRGPFVDPDAGVPTGDPGCAMQATWLDRDGDGYGDPATMAMSCEVRWGGMRRGGDCNDACAICHPGGSETCEGALDEDCDGDVDEGCQCTVGALRPCAGGVDTGPCASGTQACVEGRWSECVGRFDPIDESCNAIDDDCDGTIDDAAQRSCGPGCHQSCALGLWGDCVDRAGIPCHDR